MRADERCFHFLHGQLEVRVWITAESLSSSTEEVEQRSALANAIDAAEDISSSRPTKVVTAEHVAKVPGVSAVEVKARGDNAAVLIYPDWP